ncbi:MAG: cyclic nucleotide-binding domain-containing protein [Verrucomicrobiota bacterium]
MSEGKLTRPELPRFGILKGMEDEDRVHLSDFGEFLPAHSKQQIITNGMPQDSLFFVISGVLHVHMTVDGREKLITRIEAGETFGEVNVFDPAVASASVTSQEFSQIWRANRADIEAFVEAYPKAGCHLLSGILAGMSRRIRHMNERLTDQESQNELLRMWH